MVDYQSAKDIFIIKKMVCLLKPYIKSILLFFFIMLLSTGVSFVLPQINRIIIDKGFLKKDFDLILNYSILTFFLILIDSLISILRNFLQVKTKTAISTSLFYQSFDKLYTIKNEYFQQNNYTDIFNRLNYDINNISLITDGNILFILAQILRVLGGILGLLLISNNLTLIVLAIIPLRLLIFKVLAVKRKKISQKSMEYNSDLANWFGESIEGIKEIKLFNIKKIKSKELYSKLLKVNEKERDNTFINSLNQSSEQILSCILNSLIYVLGAIYVFSEKLSLGSVIAFITYATYVTAPISSILNVGFLLSGVIPSAKRYFEFMDLETEYTIGEKKIENSSIDSIEFNNVNFLYDNKEVLNNVSFKILKTEKVAIVGNNASGKTTIINLMLRFNQINNGNILINDQTIYSYNMESYRKKFALVSQDIFLFDRSIEDNISMGENKNINMSLIDNFIGKMELDYKVGVKSAKISGGQKQKIAIARSLYRDAEIYIFDEATSNIDCLSETFFNNLINNHLKDKTVITITHKQEILKKLDKIIYLQDGNVCGVGKHDELLLNCESYRFFITNRVVTNAKVVK